MNNKLSLTFILTPLLLAMWLSSRAHAYWELLPGTELIGRYPMVATDGTRLYASADAALYISDDDSGTWRYFEVAPDIEDFTILLIASGYGSVYIASSDHGIYRSDDGGETWHPKNAGLIQIDRGDPDGTLYPPFLNQILVTRSRTVIAVGYHSGSWVSRDRGDSWDDVTFKWESPKRLPLGTAVWSMTEFDGYWWAVHSTYTLCRSHDQGATWEILPVDMGRFDHPQAWAQLDNRLYVAGNKTFARWNEDELEWEPLARGHPAKTTISHLAVNRGRIFASFNLYDLGVWLFEQQSETWVPAGLQDVRVYSVASHGSDLYAGTENGIYRASIPIVNPHGKAAATWGALKTE